MSLPGLGLILSPEIFGLSTIKWTRTERFDFSPVYDPVPMRAYSIHNMLNVMPFGDYGDYIDGRDEPVDFTLAVQRFNQALGLDHNSLIELVNELLNVTADFCEHINHLKRVPEENKKNLIQIHKKIKNSLSSL